MALRRAYWVNDAEAELDGILYAVGYKHQIDHIPTNPGEVTHFYRYRGHDEKTDLDGTAWAWGAVIKAHVERTGKMIIAEPEWGGGKLLDAECIDCCGEKLLIMVKLASSETIQVRNSPDHPSKGWAPKGYRDRNHMWNDIRLRRS